MQEEELWKKKFTNIRTNYNLKGPIPLTNIPKEILKKFEKYNMKLTKLDLFDDGIFDENGKIKKAHLGQIPNEAMEYIKFENTKSVWNNDLLENLIELANNNVDFSPTWYPTSVLQFYKAFDKFNIKNLDMMVAGSICPWIECIALSRNAKTISTVDYNLPICNSDKIKLISMDEIKNKPHQFDAICSFSSIEHDGLGRYGDPIDPDGDFAAIKEFELLLKDKGILFCGFPVGKGCIQGNLHRIYNKQRFEALIQGFDLVDIVPYPHDGTISWKGTSFLNQPVFILQYQRK